MKPTLNDKLIAYITLLSGLAISGVAEYYSIMGLIAIYPAAFWPIVIMGVVLGIGKISGTVWLKQNWEWAPFFLKAYVLPAIFILMLITSLGVFGFLSKAHSDQSLVSGDVQSKIAVYDEKIKTSKDNIDANRKALKQMDEAVDQVMGRSSDEKGADKAVAIRRAQQKERSRLLSEITTEQTTISRLNEERAPIAAEVRKVEAEVGPIKYIAHLLYGANPDANILEKAVIWVTVLIVIVLDPLAVVLLLSSQYSFQRFKELEQEDYLLHTTVPAYVEPPPKEEQFSEWTEDDFDELAEEAFAEGDSPKGPVDIVEGQPTVTEPIDCNKCGTQLVDAPGIGLFCPNKECDVLDGPFSDEPTPEITVIPPAPTPIKNSSNLRTQVKVFRPPEASEITEEVVQVALEEPVKVTPHHSGDYIEINGQMYHKNNIPSKLVSYVQNEEQKESNLWSTTTVDNTANKKE